MMLYYNALTIDSTTHVPVVAEALKLVKLPDTNQPNVTGVVVPISLVDVSVD